MTDPTPQQTVRLEQLKSRIDDLTTAVEKHNESWANACIADIQGHLHSLMLAGWWKEDRK